jgi:hypothetical protein
VRKWQNGAIKWSVYCLLIVEWGYNIEQALIILSRLKTMV